MGTGRGGQGRGWHGAPIPAVQPQPCPGCREEAWSQAGVQASSLLRHGATGTPDPLRGARGTWGWAWSPQAGEASPARTGLTLQAAAAGAGTGGRRGGLRPHHGGEGAFLLHRRDHVDGGEGEDPGGGGGVGARREGDGGGAERGAGGHDCGERPTQAGQSWGRGIAPQAGYQHIPVTPRGTRLARARARTEAVSAVSPLPLGFATGFGDIPGLVHGIGDTPGLVHGIGDTPRLVHGVGDTPGLVYGIGDAPRLVHSTGDTLGLVHGVGDTPRLVHSIGDTPGLVHGVGDAPGLLVHGFGDT